MNLQQFNDLRRRNNAIFLQVTHTREQLQDAEVLSKLSHRVLVGNASKIADLKSRYDFDVFAQSIRDKFEDTARGNGGSSDCSSGRSSSSNNGGNGVFSWSRLGMDVGCLFLSPAGGPGTMLGPISKEETVRKPQKARVQKEDLVSLFYMRWIA